jgi:hypothetical protein
MKLKILKDYDHGRAKFRVNAPETPVVADELGLYLISIGVARNITSPFATSVEFDSANIAPSTVPPAPKKSAKQAKNKESKTKAEDIEEEEKEDTLWNSVVV